MFGGWPNAATSARSESNASRAVTRVALLRWARVAVADWAQLRDEIGALQGRAAGLVRIATNDYAASTYLPAILAGFAKWQPEIRISVSIALEPIRLLEGAWDHLRLVLPGRPKVYALCDWYVRELLVTRQQHTRADLERVLAVAHE